MLLAVCNRHDNFFCIIDCLLVDAALMRTDNNHHLDLIDSGPAASSLKRGHGEMMDGSGHHSHHHGSGGSVIEGEEDPLALMEAEQAGPNSLLMQGLAGKILCLLVMCILCVPKPVCVCACVCVCHVDNAFELCFLAIYHHALLTCCVIGPMAKRLRDESGLAGSGTDEHSWQAGVRKDRAISNYYKRLTINNDIKFYLDLSNRELVGEAIKRNAKTKMNALLMKKIEDRYDDLNF